MKAYLGAYYGRSTYVRGNQFKKDYVYYSFLNKEEVLANFPDHEEGNGDGQVNAITVASDETRWGYPANMKVYGNFIVQGQDLFLYKKLTQNYSRTHLIPEDNESPYALFPWNDGNYDVGSLNCPKAKTMAYVHTLMQVFGFGFLPSFYKVQVFLNTLWAQYSGVTTPELLEQLRQYEQSISNARYGNELTLYGIKFGLTNEESDSLQDIRSKLSSVTNDNTTQNAFFVSLKGCGNVLAKFITLARSDKLHASVLTHFTDGSTSSINASSYIEEYKTTMNPLYHKALGVSDETREKIINELGNEDDKPATEDNDAPTVEERDNTGDTSTDVSEIPPLFT